MVTVNAGFLTSSGKIWNGCSASASRQNDRDGCVRISSITQQRKRYCETSDCKCPWRVKPANSSQKAAPARPTSAPPVEKKAEKVVPRWKEMAARAKHAFATKRHMRVDPDTCVPMQGKRGQPRKIFTKRGLEKLRRSLVDVGQIHPAFVRKIGKDQREIFAGERRWRCIKTIPGMLYEVFECDVPDDNLLPFMMAVICDSYQEALSPLEKCDAIRQMWDDEEMEIEDVAEMFGMSVQKAKDLAQLTHLSPQVRDMMNPESEDPLPELAAIRIAKAHIGDYQTQLRVAQMFLTGELKVAELSSGTRVVNRSWTRPKRVTPSRRIPVSAPAMTVQKRPQAPLSPLLQFASTTGELSHSAADVHQKLRSTMFLREVLSDGTVKSQLLTDLKMARRYIQFTLDILDPTKK